MKRIVIVGGGITGLTLAYRLEQRLPGVAATVFEREPRVGGKIGTLEADGFRVETGPNGFLDNKPPMLDLCRELGLADRLVSASEAARVNRFLFLRGRLRRLPSGLGSFLTTDVLGFCSKLAILLERFRPRRRETGDESIDVFLRRRVGREIAVTLGDAFVTGIYAGDATRLSVGACFPRLVEFERNHGSVLRGFAASARQRKAAAAAKGEPPPPGPRMWSFREGLGLLTETLRARLRRAPVTGVSVCALRHLPDAKVWHVEVDGGERYLADAVVLACPAYVQAELLAGIDQELSTLIGGIAYNRLAVVALGYRTSDIGMSLDGFGYLSPQRERHDVLGVQWCSSIYPGRAPDGLTLLRAMCGGWNRPELAMWDDARLVAAVRGLAVSMRVRAAPVFSRVVRWERAIPQYLVGHLERVARIEARAAAHAGLYLTGNSYRGVALNDCVEQANALAERLQKQS